MLANTLLQRKIMAKQQGLRRKLRIVLKKSYIRKIVVI